jgi:xylono-1,5-lactonase
VAGFQGSDVTEYEVVVHTQDALGEGPTWVAAENSIFWVDILGQRLQRHRLTDGKLTSWNTPEPICWLIERQVGGYIAGFASGFAQLSLEPFELGPVHRLGLPRANHRLNDAKVDPAGRLWAGVMEMTAATPTGSLYRIDSDAPPVCVEGSYLVPNGTAFSPAGDWMYHADSPRGIIYRYAVGADGALGDRREHIRFQDDWGLPDGMTVDAQSNLWVAHWDGGRVSRFDPDGRLDRAIRLPASRITSCVFGGDLLDRLFITSSGADREHEALAGALFEVDPGTTGIASAKFAG